MSISEPEIIHPKIKEWYRKLQDGFCESSDALDSLDCHAGDKTEGLCKEKVLKSIRKYQRDLVQLIRDIRENDL